MTAEIPIGDLIPTKIPGYSDDADIQAALRLYHYGSYTYSPSNTSPANLVSPSIAKTIYDIEQDISTLDVGSIKNTIFTAKGQILTATASNSPTVLTVGTNNQFLIANNATASGLQWTNTLTAPTISTPTISGGTFTSPQINLGAPNAQTGTTFIPGLSDNGKLVTLNNASPIALTVPSNTSVAYATGAQINIVQLGDGQVTVSGDAGVTVYSTPGSKLREKYSAATLIKLDTDTWLLTGDLSA